MMKKRKMHVTSIYRTWQRGIGMGETVYKECPRIVLQGEWLRQAGFERDDKIRVKVEDGKITIKKKVKKEEEPEA